MSQVKPLTPIGETKRIERSLVGPPPRLAWLGLDQLVINADYQRSLSNASLALIRRMVAEWDWNRFKALSVAPTGDGLYEVVDGQHTALAAATHGSIETLPCLVLTAATVAEKAAAFVGINADRISLTPFALYRARVAAGDAEAVAVREGLETAGVTLVSQLRYGAETPEGVAACVSTLLGLARRGGKARVARLLALVKGGGITPVPAALLRGLEVLTAQDDAPSAEAITAALRATDIEALQDRVDLARLDDPGLNQPKAWAQVVRELAA